MPKVLILGAGKIGALISGLLAESGSYEVHLADVSGEAANAVVNAHRFPNLHAHTLDATDTAALDAHLQKQPVAAGISRGPHDRRRLAAGVRAPMRPRPRLHLDRGQRADRPLRRAADREAARRRPAP